MAENDLRVGGGCLTDTMLAELLPTRVMWSAPEMNSKLFINHNNTLKWLRRYVKAGQAIRLGGQGTSARWCHISRWTEALEAITDMRAEVQAKRIRRHSERRSERRDAKRNSRPIPPPRNVKRKDRQPEAFTIPPRGVPCSVWALGEMA